LPAVLHVLHRRCASVCARCVCEMCGGYSP
jgi:hypothetical protein